MRIRVVNPNTTRAMTDTIEQCALAVAGRGTLLDAVTSQIGPASIESHYDEAMSVPGLLAAIRQGEADGVDGYVIACFGDPGLDAARELAAGPVIGIAEAAMRTASHWVADSVSSRRSTAPSGGRRIWRNTMGCSGSAGGFTRVRYRYSHSIPTRTRARSSPRRVGWPSRRTGPTLWCSGAREWPICARTSATRSGCR